MNVFRRTTSVKAIIEIFDNFHGALSVVKLVEQVSGQMNKTTVYRILEKLEGAGILHSFIGKEGLTWYAKCDDCSATQHTDSHPHFHCSECGKVECLQIDISIPSVPNHRVDSANVMLLGRCENCSSSPE